MSQNKSNDSARSVPACRRAVCFVQRLVTSFQSRSPSPHHSLPDVALAIMFQNYSNALLPTCIDGNSNMSLPPLISFLSGIGACVCVCLVVCSLSRLLFLSARIKRLSSFNVKTRRRCVLALRYATGSGYDAALLTRRDTEGLGFYLIIAISMSVFIRPAYLLPSAIGWSIFSPHVCFEAR